MLSFFLLVVVAGLLLWSSRELKEASGNDILADDIQTRVFQRAALRDEYLLHGTETSRVRWSGINDRIERLLKQAGTQFDRAEDLAVLDDLRSRFEQSMHASSRLVERLQKVAPKEWESAQRDEFCALLYGRIMMRDAALEQGATTLQKMARDRFNAANRRTMALTLALVFITAAAIIANSAFINSLLRRRLTMLNEGARIVGSGDFSYRLESEGDDELAELGRVFNAVTGKVQEYTRQLQRSHDLLSNLSSQVPGVLFQAHLSPEGEFTTPYVSRGASDICPSAAGGADAGIFDMGPGGDLFSSFALSAQTLKPWEQEYCITLADGSQKWLHGQARPMRLEDGGTLWHGFLSDISERKKMEEALCESETRYRLQLQELSNIYTHTPAGLFAVDRELRFLRLNERMAEINGRPIEEHLGRSIEEVLHPDLAATLKRIWRPVLERGECIMDLELHGSYRASPGTARHWLGSYQPILSDAGTVTGLMGSVLDITERKLAEQVMAGARHELEQEVQQRTARLSLANEHLTQEIEVRKKVEEELLAQQRKLQEMALDLSMAEERERDRIAGELHDQVGQRLILAKIKLDALASHLPSQEFEAEAGGIETLIEQTIQDIRSLTFQIRPPLLASAGLEAALRWLGEELNADFGLEVFFSDDGADKPLRYDVRSSVFQAVRELMLNVAKHAGTKQCRVRFSRNEDCMAICVEDDGVGLRNVAGDGGRPRGGGFGLLNVKQKIEHLGGSFAIARRDAGGTEANINVPLEL